MKVSILIPFIFIIFNDAFGILSPRPNDERRVTPPPFSRPVPPPSRNQFRPISASNFAGQPNGPTFGGASRPLSSPSLNLIPPLTNPVSSAGSNPNLSRPIVGERENFVERIPPELSQRSPISIDGQKIELLPPIEIPPETPIDDGFDAIRSHSVQEGNQGTRPASPSRPTSFLPTTGTGNVASGSQFASVDNSFTLSPPAGSIPTTSNNRPLTTHDPGLDCLGTCDCPGDFNFVCGSNRFLYQNQCALECDKKCHPDVIQVSMDNCSRK